MRFAKLMTTIESPKWGEREKTENQFYKILVRIEQVCPEANAEKLGDMMAYSYKEIKDAKLNHQESFLNLSNNILELAIELYELANKNKGKTQSCADTMAMYITLRKENYSPYQTKNGIISMIEGLYRLNK